MSKKGEPIPPGFGIEKPGPIPPEILRKIKQTKKGGVVTQTSDIPKVITDRDTARKTIPKIKEQMNTLTNKIEQVAILREQIKNNRAKAQEKIRNTKINADKYTASSVDAVINEATAYLKNTEKTDTELENYIKDLMTSRASYNKNITNLENWIEDVTEYMDKYGEELREAVIEKGAGKRYTKAEIEEKIREAVIERKAGKVTPTLARKRKTTLKPPERKGPFAGILKKLDDKKEQYFKKMNLSPDEWKGKTSYLDYLVKTRSRGFSPVRTKEQKQAQLGWIGANVAIAGLTSAPVVVANTAGMVVGSPLGMVFVPLTVSALQWLDRKEHESYLDYLKKTRTPSETKSTYKQILQDHPELYDAMYIQGLTTLGLLYGSSKLGSFIGPSTKKVSMTPKEYAHYRKSHPWSGGMASELMEQDESWIHMLVEGLLDKTSPKSVKWFDTRKTRGIRRYKPYHWQIEEKVFPTLPIDKGYSTSPIVWINILKVGAYDRVLKELRNRGLTESQIKAIVPTEAEIQAYKLKDISILDFPNIEDMKEFYLESELLNSMLEQGQLAQQSLKLEQGQQSIQDLMMTQEQLQEQLQELEPGLDIPAPPKIELPETPTIPELPELSKLKESPKSSLIPKDSFTVKFTDYEGRSESHDVQAKTFHEAYMKAFHIRRWHGLLHEVDITRRS